MKSTSPSHWSFGKALFAAIFNRHSLTVLGRKATSAVGAWAGEVMRRMNYANVAIAFVAVCGGSQPQAKPRLGEANRAPGGRDPGWDGEGDVWIVMSPTVEGYESYSYAFDVWSKPAPEPEPVAEDPVADDDERPILGSCSTTPVTPSAGWLVLVLVGLLVRRRS